MKRIVLNPFTIDPDEHSAKFGLVCNDPSLTVQADVQQADINFIVKQFGLTHELPYGRAIPIFDDYSDIPNDFHAAQQYIQESEDLFMLMPADIRSRFDNDAGRFVSFVSDASNYDEAIKFGLVPKRPVSPVDGVSAPPISPSDMSNPPLDNSKASGGS